MLRRARAIDTLSASSEPIVIGGDFNSWWGEDEPAIRDLRRAFPDAGPSGSTSTWGGVLRAVGALDHIFARVDGRLQVQRIPDKLGSDHYPLLTIVPTALTSPPPSRARASRRYSDRAGSTS